MLDQNGAQWFSVSRNLRQGFGRKAIQVDLDGASLDRNSVRTRRQHDLAVQDVSLAPDGEGPEYDRKAPVPGQRTRHVLFMHEQGAEGFGNILRLDGFDFAYDRGRRRILRLKATEGRDDVFEGFGHRSQWI